MGSAPGPDPDAAAGPATGPDARASAGAVPEPRPSAVAAAHPRGGPIRAGSGARVCTIAAFVCAVIALVLYPPLFALAAVVLGVLGARRGDKPLGWYATAAGVAGGIIGMILGAVAAAAR